MKVKYAIYFVLLIIVLVVSEYIFLTELNTRQRLGILFLTSFIAISSIVAIFICYRRIGHES